MLGGTVPRGCAIRVQLHRTGGFTGIQARRDLDTATLPPDQAARLQDLIATLDLDTLARRELTGRPMPDGFTYQLVVEHSGRRWQFTVREPDVPAPVQRLLDHLHAAS